MGVVEVITVVVEPLQIVPRKVGLGVGDTGVQSNDDDTDEVIPKGTLIEVNKESPENA